MCSEMSCLRNVTDGVDNKECPSGQGPSQLTLDDDLQQSPSPITQFDGEALYKDVQQYIALFLLGNTPALVGQLSLHK